MKRKIVVVYSEKPVEIDILARFLAQKLIEERGGKKDERKNDLRTAS